jgi:hypothetical protein
VRLPSSAILACTLLTFSQRDAAAAWPAGAVSVAPSDGDAFGYRVAPDRLGGAYVAWLGLDRNVHDHLEISRFDPDGRPAPGWPDRGVEVAPVSGLSDPITIPDGASGVYVLWHDFSHGPMPELRLQRVTTDGTAPPGWPAGGIPVGTGLLGQHQFGSGSTSLYGTVATSDGCGGIAVAWVESSPASDLDIRAQRISPDGVRLWGEHGITVCAAQGEQEHPAIAAGSHGDVFITWQDARDVSVGNQIYAQHIAANGEVTFAVDGKRLSTSILPNAQLPVIAAFHGDAVIVWQAGGSRGYSLFAQRVKANGIRLWSEDTFVCRNVGGNVYPVPVAVPCSDGVLVAWFDTRTRVDWNIYAQRLTAGGHAAGGWATDGVLVAPAPPKKPLFREVLVSASDGHDGAYIAWTERYPAGDDIRIDGLATHVTRRGEVPAGWPVTGRMLSDSTRMLWVPALDVVPDDDGGAFAVWSDNGPGGLSRTWVQRLAADTVRHEPPLEVSPGMVQSSTRAPELTVRASGADGSRIALTLRDGTRARLEIWDVAGRRLVSKQVSGLGAGAHVLALERSLAAGIYFMRLTQGGATARARLPVTR